MKMNRWIFPLALCFLCASSNNGQYYEKFCEDVEACPTQRWPATLGSSVLLPCTIMTNNLSWILWVHKPVVQLVHISSSGRIMFLNPRSGRLKAFPNQGSQGNYSILIDELEDSDLGCYSCNHNGACQQLELVEGPKDTDRQLLIYIFAAVVVFILLSFCSYLTFSLRKQRSANSRADAIIEVARASAPPQEISPPAVQEQQEVDNSVYENDAFDLANYLGDLVRNRSDVLGVSQASNQNEPAPSTSGIYPNLNQFNFERKQSRRTKLRFHRELMNRLRQASVRRHHYVNQHELREQQVTSTQPQKHHRGAGRKKANDNCEYKNPIYNRSTEQLNQL